MDNDHEAQAYDLYKIWLNDGQDRWEHLSRKDRARWDALVDSITDVVRIRLAAAYQQDHQEKVAAFAEEEKISRDPWAFPRRVSRAAPRPSLLSELAGLFSSLSRAIDPSARR